MPDTSNSSYVSENILLCLLSGIHHQDKFPKIYLRLQYYKNINKNSPQITPVKAGRQMMKDPPKITYIFNNFNLFDLNRISPSPFASQLLTP